MLAFSQLEERTQFKAMNSQIKTIQLVLILVCIYIYRIHKQTYNRSSEELRAQEDKPIADRLKKELKKRTSSSNLWV